MCSVYQNALHICHCCLVANHVWRSCDPMYCSPQGSSVHRISRQEHWSGLSFPSPGDLPNPEVETTSLPGFIGRQSRPTEPPGKPSAYLQYNDTFYLSVYQLSIYPIVNERCSRNNLVNACSLLCLLFIWCWVVDHEHGLSFVAEEMVWYDGRAQTRELLKL